MKGRMVEEIIAENLTSLRSDTYFYHRRPKVPNKINSNRITLTDIVAFI